MTLTIVSGGQTGADRAALDAALACGAPIGGWVPAGRLAEDGPISSRYVGLRETPSAEPAERTRHNVLDSDGTLALTHGPPAGGTALALRIAQESGRPALHLDLDGLAPGTAADAAADWVLATRIATLNVAGPRASEDPRAYGDTLDVVTALLTRLARG